jgi:hypothetical protein
MFRNVALECLTEIGSLNIGNMYDAQFEKLFIGVMNQLKNIITNEASILLDLLKVSMKFP